MVVLSDFSIGLALTFNAQQANAGAQQSAQIFTDLQTRLGQVAGSVPAVGQAFQQTGSQVQAASQSMGTTFTAAGQQIQTTSQQMKTSLDATSQTFTTLDAAGRQVGTGMQSLNTTFSAGLATTKQSGDAFANLRTNLETVHPSTQTNVDKMSLLNTSMTTTVLGVSTLMTSVINLGTGIRDWSDANIAVEAAQRKVSTATEAQGKAQDKLEALVRKGVTSGKDYEQAQLDVAQAEQQVSIMTQRLGERQEDLFDSQLRFAMSVAPTVLSAFGTITSIMKQMQESGLNLGTMFSGIGSKISSGFSGIGSIMSSTAGQIGIVSAAAVAALAVINTYVQSQAAIAKFNDVLSEHAVKWDNVAAAAEKAKSTLSGQFLGQLLNFRDIPEIEKFQKKAQDMAVAQNVFGNINLKQEAPRFGADFQSQLEAEASYIRRSLSNYNNFFTQINGKYQIDWDKIKTTDGLINAAITRMQTTLTNGRAEADKFDLSTNHLIATLGKYPAISDEARKAIMGQMDATIQANVSTEQNAKENQKWVDATNEIQMALGKTIPVTKESGAAYLALGEALAENRTGWQAEEASLVSVAVKHDALNSKLLEYISNSANDVVAMRENIAANIDYTKALTDSTLNVDLMSKGHLAGAIALDDYTKALVTNAAQGETYRAGLEKIYAQVTGLTDAYKLTVPQLQEQIRLKTDETYAHEKAIEQYQKAVAEQQKMSDAVSDLNNQYEMHLNPNLIKTSKQLADATKAVQDYQKALEQVTNSINDVQNFDIKAIKIDFEVEDTYKDFLKNLDKDTRKEVTLEIKSKAANEAAAKVLEAFAGTTLYIDAQANVEFKTNETKVDDYINTMVTTIQEKFNQKGQDPQVNAGINTVLKKMLEIKGQPDSWTKLSAYFKSPDFLTAIASMPEASKAILQGLTGAAPAEAQLKPIGETIAKSFVTSLESSINTGLSQVNINYAAISSGGVIDPEKVKALHDKPAQQNALKLPIVPDMATFETSLNAALTKLQGAYTANAAGVAGTGATGKSFNIPIAVDTTSLTASLTSVTDAWTKMSSDVTILQEAMVQAVVSLYTETLYGQGIAPMLVTAAGSFADYESQITEQEGSMIVAVVGLYGTLLEQIAVALASAEKSFTDYEAVILSTEASSMLGITGLYLQWYSDIGKTIVEIAKSFKDYEAALLSDEAASMLGITGLYLQWYKDIGATLIQIAKSFKDYEATILASETKVIGDMLKLWNQFVTGMVSIMEQVNKAFVEGGKDWQETTKDAVDKMIEEFTKMVNAVKDVVSRVNTEIGKIKTDVTVKVNYDTSGKPSGLAFGASFYTGAQSGLDITTKRGQPQMILVGEGPNIERVRVSRQGEPEFYDRDHNKGGGSSTIVLNADITVVASDGSYMGKGRVRRVFPNLESH